MGQFIQIVGALLILGGFVFQQIGRLHHRSYVYLFVNFVGSAILAVLALEERQWGFLLLEGVWAVVALWGLGLRLRGGEPVSAR